MHGLVTLLVVNLSLALAAPATPGRGDRSKRRRERPAQDEDLSRGGTRRGAVEISLGVAVLGTGAILVGRGVWEIASGRQLEKDCAAFESMDVLCDRDAPARGHKVAAGLAFGFAVPLFVAGSLLLARGARVHRDFRKARRQNRAVALRPAPGGLALHF